MPPRYKGKDEIGAWYYGFVEDNFGNTPTPTGNTTLRIGIVTEIVPIFDPEITPVYVLRDGAVAGKPFTLLSRKNNVRCRLTWIQQTTPSQAVYSRYWQHNYLREPKEASPNNFTNFFLEAKIKDFWLRFTGLKPNIVTIRSSIGEPQTWIAECIGKALSLATAKACDNVEAEDTDPPWMWNDTYVQWRETGGTYADFPDLTDYEFRIDKNLKPNFIFNSAGSKELASLEEQEWKATARLTANLTSKDFLNYLLSLTSIDLKLMMPDSKYLELKSGKFQAVEPTIKPEDLIAQRIDYVAEDYDHNF